MKLPFLLFIRNWKIGALDPIVCVCWMDQVNTLFAKKQNAIRMERAWEPRTKGICWLEIFDFLAANFFFRCSHSTCSQILKSRPKEKTGMTPSSDPSSFNRSFVAIEFRLRLGLLSGIRYVETYHDDFSLLRYKIALELHTTQESML